MRDIGDGPEKIVKQEELAAVRRLGRQVTLQSVVAGVIATAAFVVVP